MATAPQKDVQDVLQWYVDPRIRQRTIISVDSDFKKSSWARTKGEHDWIGQLNAWQVPHRHLRNLRGKEEESERREPPQTLEAPEDLATTVTTPATTKCHPVPPEDTQRRHQDQRHQHRSHHRRGHGEILKMTKWNG